MENKSSGARSSPHSIAFAGLAIGIFLAPTVVLAGPIFGSVIGPSGVLAGVAIEVNCGGAITTGSTATDGSYGMNVPQQGQCSFTLPSYAGRPSATIFSNPNPSTYHFKLVSANGRYELQGQ